MSDERTFPSDLQYTRSHEWVRSLPNGEVEVGITDHAQDALGRSGVRRGAAARSQARPRAKPARWSNRSKPHPTSIARSRAAWLRATRSSSQKPELLNTRSLRGRLADARQLDSREPLPPRFAAAQRVRSSSSRKPSREPPCRSFRTPPMTSRTCSRPSERHRSTRCSTRFPPASRRSRSTECRRRSAKWRSCRLITERAARRWPPAQLHRRRRLRAPYSGARVGHRDAR